MSGRTVKSVSATASEGVALGSKRGRAKNTDPERRRKIAESKRGVPRPDHVIEAMRKGRTGKPQSAETRKRMSESHGNRVRVRGRAWSRDEDALLGELTDEEVARRTKRTVAAVVSRRKKRGVEKYDG